MNSLAVRRIHHIVGDMMSVIDTNVIVSGLRSSLGASYQILQAIGDQRLELALSVPLFLEYEDVLKSSV